MVSKGEAVRRIAEAVPIVLIGFGGGFLLGRHDRHEGKAPASHHAAIPLLAKAVLHQGLKFPLPPNCRQYEVSLKPGQSAKLLNHDVAERDSKVPMADNAIVVENQSAVSSEAPLTRLSVDHINQAVGRHAIHTAIAGDGLASFSLGGGFEANIDSNIDSEHPGRLYLIGQVCGSHPNG